MLKIRSFLRRTKDSIMNFIKKLFQRYSRHMAATAYALSAIILVFHFGDLADLAVDKSTLVVDASSYEFGAAKSEETNASEPFVSDNKEYALIGPDNHIVQTLTETADKLPTDLIKLSSVTRYPLGQLSLSQATATKYDLPVAMAILKSKQELCYTTKEKEMMNLFQLDHGVLVDTTDSTESKVEVTKEETVASKTVKEEKELAEATKDESKKDTKMDSFQKEQSSQEQSAQEQSSQEKSPKEQSLKDQAQESSEATETLAASKKSIPSNLKLTMNSKMKKSLSKKELEVLQRIVEAEASGEDIYGKILVANVVINRMNSEEFPDTVSDVVFQREGNCYQFSPTNDGRYYTVKVSKSTKEAVKRALSGEDYSKGALYFFARRLTTEKKASWFDNSLRKVVQYGCHEFYADR